ncbi:hypothetical protein HPP92_020337 [Vanilla planifolia]|uniref:Uncharacterized protein n=1 Tax=Vanilla planifolia TaxID=51239 RepID=A0A835Q895_VANPL|nr:hypothetical protein HPP92_020337 [Vanilla planifolia]
MVSSFPYPVLTLKLLAPSYYFVSFRMERFTSTTKARVSILAPPQEFDYRTEIMEETISAVSSELPELMDLVDEGRLVMVEKRRFGPVPKWRRDFLEPEVIWLVDTSHTSQKSAKDVERVVRALRPDNVVVELCRSRVHFQSWDNVHSKC